MTLKHLLPALLLLFVTTARAQFQDQWEVYTNDGAQRARVSSFASVNEARTIIDEIINVMNLKVNFEVREANVPNAGAVFYNKKRYILYNPAFIRQIDRAAGTDWASISILAHEIGHHVKGHVFSSNGGSSHQNELEADEFSGLVLKRMGASLEQAQLAMRMISGNRASATHPGKSDRLDAIAKGWNAGTQVNDHMASRRTDSSRSTATVQTTTTTAGTRTLSRAAAIADHQILVDVQFKADRKNEYFVTTGYNVVKWDGYQLIKVGKLARLNNGSFPFYIYDAQKNYVLVAKDGYLVNKEGARVGHLQMHTAAATAAR